MLRSPRFILALVFLVWPMQALATASGVTVSHIWVSAQPQQSVANVLIGQSKGAMARSTVQLGQFFATGTQLELPGGVRMQMTSTNGTVLQALPATAFRVRIGRQAGSVDVSKGKVEARVGPSVRSFSLNSGGNRYAGHADGTQFSISVDQQGVSFARTEGRVLVRRQVPISVGAAGAAQDSKRRPEPTVGEITELSAARNEAFFDPTDKGAIEFQTYDQAIGFYQNAYRQALETNDRMMAADILSAIGLLELDSGSPARAIDMLEAAINLNLQLIQDGLDPVFAEDRTNLGYAYLDDGRAKDALTQFEMVFDLLATIDPASPLLAESLLDIAEANITLGNGDAAEDAVSDAIVILEADIAFGRVVFEEIMEQYEGRPNELAAMVALEVGQQLGSLGWAYEQLAERYQSAEALARAQAAFDEADEISDMLWEIGIDAGY